MTGSTAATVNCRHPNLYPSLWRRRATEQRGFLSGWLCLCLCLCLCTWGWGGAGGRPAHTKNAFVFPGLLPIAGRGGKTALFLSFYISRSSFWHSAFVLPPSLFYILRPCPFQVCLLSSATGDTLNVTIA